MKTSQKGFVPLIVLAIIAALAIGGGIYYYSKNQSTNYQNIQVGDLNVGIPSSWEQYKNNNISTDPTKWASYSGVKNEQAGVEYNASSDHTSTFSIQATRIKGFDFTSLVQQNISVQTGVIDSIARSIGGYPAYVLTRNDTGSNMPVRHYQAYINAGDEYYLLNYTMKAGDFSKDETIFDDIINSIKITK